MILRPMTDGDIGEVLEIENISFAAPWTRGIFRQTLASPIARSLVLNSATRILGYVIFYYAGTEMHIMNIAVHPSHRKRGLAFEILTEVFDLARRYLIVECYLEVQESNFSARGLYEKLGFQPVGRRKGYYSETNEDAIVMKLAL